MDVGLDSQEHTSLIHVASQGVSQVVLVLVVVHRLGHHHHGNGMRLVAAIAPPGPVPPPLQEVEVAVIQHCLV